MNDPAFDARRAADTTVPFLDLRGVNARFSAEMEAAMRALLESGRYLMGDENRRFADEYASWTGAMHCVPLANGLDALRLALRGWTTLGRLAPGDEVVVPANSFIASALAVSEAHLEVQLADVDADTFCVTSETIQAAMTRKTRAIMPVHLYGHLSDPGSIRSLCAGAGLIMLEDAAQAHGASVGGRRAGTFGDAGAFSFYPSKNLGALGDAGCLVTDDPELAARVRMLGNYGAPRKYEHEFRGTNSRMDELQAAVLRIKLARLDADNARRREIAAQYLARIDHSQVRLPLAPNDAHAHVWHLFVVCVDKRASLVDHLAAHGIETLIHYPASIHHQPAYREALSKARCPVAERLERLVLSLPMSPIMTDAQVTRVVNAVNSWVGPRPN